MSFTGSLSFGGSPASATRFASTRGRINGSTTQGINYPSPFFDVAHTYLPTTVKQLFRFCRYYFLTNPLINATVFKLSEYPVTDIVIDHEDEKVKKRWMEYYHDHLRYRSFQIESGLDYHAYGNCAVSLSFPFFKYLTCKVCDWSERADKTRNYWTFTNYEFRLRCPRCGHTTDALVKDHYYPNASGIRMVRWNVEDIEVNYNDITGQSTYFYTIPGPLQSDVVIGKKDVVEAIPQIFIQALRQRKGVVFSKDNFFHLKRPTLAWQDRGWGTPIILPVLKDTFYLQIMKKAQEAVLLEHIVPLRVIFPQGASGTSDPFCVSPDTLVETVGGLQPACEVRMGDYLRSHTGAWRRVEAQKRRAVGHDEKVYKVTVASLAGFPFEVSEEHPLLAVRSTSGRKRGRQVWTDPEFIPVQDLKVGDYVAYPTKRVQGSLYEVLDLKQYLTERAHTETFTYLKLSQGTAEVYEYLESRDFAAHGHGERAALLTCNGWKLEDYETAFAMKGQGIARISRFMSLCEPLSTLIGYYLAEGSRRGCLVSMAFHEDETYLHADVERCVKELGFAKGTTLHPNTKGHGVDVVINSVLLAELLISMCGYGFTNKQIPVEISESDDVFVTSMLASLFAGDGCDFHTTTNRVALKLSNPDMILEARRLLLSFGLLGGVIAEPPTEGSKHKTTAYHLNYNGAAAEALRLLLKEDRHPSVGTPQQCSGIFRGDYVLMPIRKLEEVSTIPEVIGFQMYGDRSFCVAGVATHNTTLNLVDWRDQVASEIARWRYDNNYIPIMPIPMGQQSIGGDGKALLLFNEMQSLSEHIIMGMGVPREFLMGGMSYAGTNVSMRMLENQFISYLGHHRAMAKWVMKTVANYMGWPEANIRFKPFKMADDLQRKAYLFQLNQAGKISDTTLLTDADLEQSEENEIMSNEADNRIDGQKKQQIAMAEIQGESQMIMMKYQAKAQEAAMAAQQGGMAPGEPGGPEGAMDPGGADQMAEQSPGPEGGGEGGIPADVESPISPEQRLAPGAEGQPGAEGGQDITQMAQAIAQQVSQMPPDQQQQALMAIEAQFGTEMSQLVQQLIGSMGGGAEQPAVDTRPLPEQLPPRRDNALV